MKRRKTTKISDQIRAAIEDSESSRYALAKETGVSQGALSRFVNGHNKLSLDAIDLLGEFFGWELKPKSKRKQGK